MERHHRTITRRLHRTASAEVPAVPRCGPVAIVWIQVAMILGFLLGLGVAPASAQDLRVGPPTILIMSELIMSEV
jgi:hypothetical protein